MVPVSNMRELGCSLLKVNCSASICAARGWTSVVPAAVPRRCLSLAVHSPGRVRRSGPIAPVRLGGTRCGGRVFFSGAHAEDVGHCRYTNLIIPAKELIGDAPGPQAL